MPDAPDTVSDAIDPFTPADHATYAQLDERLRTLLPAEYHACYEEVQPVSMGSAGLKFDADGNVAWDQIWGSFCDLAMAGGPPHKGTLLQAGRETDINAAFGQYDAVVEEICRGIRMVTSLRAYPSPSPGWISVSCHGDTMAEWLLRAIVMENVEARRAGAIVELPAAPHFRLEKEIKNVITVIAKTTHYWVGHLPRTQQRAIGDLFMRMDAESPLLVPADAEEASPHSAFPQRTPAADERRGPRLRAAISARIERSTGLRGPEQPYVFWCGVACPDVRSAVWMMRALVAINVLARRERETLFVPVNPAADPGGTHAAESVARVHRFAAARGVVAAADSRRAAGPD